MFLTVLITPPLHMFKLNHNCKQCYHFITYTRQDTQAHTCIKSHTSIPLSPSFELWTSQAQFCVIYCNNSRHLTILMNQSGRCDTTVIPSLHAHSLLLPPPSPAITLMFVWVRAAAPYPAPPSARGAWSEARQHAPCCAAGDSPASASGGLTSPP